MTFSWPAVAAADGLRLADQEGSLLHRRVVLSGITRWDRQSKTWTPFHLPPKSTAKLYVINVWSVHCKPCIDEFPLLRRVASAWMSDARVGFLFVADPPEENSQSELTALWSGAANQLPAADPLRSADPFFQKSIDIDARPVTLLVDKNLIVRQSFVGSIAARNLGTAIERLLKAVDQDR